MILSFDLIIDDDDDDDEVMEGAILRFSIG
jgi:hypothetical protein